MTLSWTAIDAMVSLIETARLQMEEATDTYKPYADYVRHDGALEPNGLGHKRIVLRGHDVGRCHLVEVRVEGQAHDTPGCGGEARSCGCQSVHNTGPE